MQGYDLIEDMYSTKTAAMNFVHELCKSRGKNNLSSFMQFVVQVMTEYQVWFTWPMRCERPWMHRVSTSLSRSRVF